MGSDNLKAEGNAAFSAGNYNLAVSKFKEALGRTPEDHVLLSNRSAAYAKMHMYLEAYEDAKRCVEINPMFVKGYSRRGFAEYHLGEIERAKETYRQGLKLAPENEALLAGLKEAETHGAQYAEEQIRQLIKLNKVKDAEFAKWCREDGGYEDRIFHLAVEVRKDPQNLVLLLSQPDERIKAGISKIFNLPAGAMGGAGVPGGDDNAEERRARESGERAKKLKREAEEEAERRRLDGLNEDQRKALKLKDEGNALYKKRDFEGAIRIYRECMDLDASETTYYCNIGSVYMEMKDFEKCIEIIDEGIEIGTKNQAPFARMGKLYQKKGNCYVKMGRLGEAIESYQKSLTENQDRVVRVALSDTKRLKEKMDKEAYIDIDKSEEHREKGNEYFKKQEYVKAKEEYDECIKRDPSNKKGWGNRSMVLMKLLEYPEALKDCQKALELDPKWVKMWARQGILHLGMKDLNRSINAYKKGLAIDETDIECQQGLTNAYMQMQQQYTSQSVDEKQIERNMQDPEIQAILRDPQMAMILREMQENPSATEKYLRDPKISEAIDKLIAAGVVRGR